MNKNYWEAMWFMMWAIITLLFWGEQVSEFGRNWISTLTAIAVFLNMGIAIWHMRQARRNE